MRFSARRFLFWKIFSLFLLLLIPFFMPRSVSAQTTVTNPSAAYYIPSTNPDVPANQHTLVQSILIEMMSSGICVLSGVDVMNPKHGCLGVDSTTHKLGYAAQNGQMGGAIGMTSSMIGNLYTPPASVLTYTHYLSQNFGITKHAYADTPPDVPKHGLGYDSLKPLLSMWVASRNLAYILFVVAFMVIGFAVMLRVKIDPRTVMTIQNQIPKIIVAIVMITFSYAIVGLLVDFMWVLTYTGINILTSPDIGGISTRTATINILDNPLQYFNQIYSTDSDDHGLLTITKNTAGSLSDIVNTVVSEALDTSSSDCISLSHGSFSPISCGKQIVYGVVFGIAKIFALLIVLIALFAALFRIWFMLVKAYMFVLFDTIVGPLWIIAGLLPGSTLSFTSWIRHLIAHLAVFPAATVMFLITRVLTIKFDSGTSSNGLFVPPLVGNATIGKGIAAIIGISMLMYIPELLNIIRDALKSPQSKYSGALGKGFNAGFGPATVIGGGLKNQLWRTNPTTHQAEGLINSMFVAGRGNRIGSALTNARNRVFGNNGRD